MEVQLYSLFFFIDHHFAEIARLRDKNMVLLDGREVLDAVGKY